ncbi:MAG: hypothetical protein A3K19_28545 [Lentisphaerae bacterium RIFOXYB12_FULL_65_16]|nr:MAG: hypothetical protein A3K18_23775 [Lentisphaerae bacterium RIFOXYA12_64_32]OGV90888.1 MAG: hypothetical protein A3K19_28545 [Lentisphaerae bacterium RIFOXYB12_FULL_65_16]
MRHQNDSSPVPLFQNFLRVFLISASLAAGQEIKTILLQDLDQRGTVVFNIERGGLVQLPPGAEAARSVAVLRQELRNVGDLVFDDDALLIVSGRAVLFPPGGWGAATDTPPAGLVKDVQDGVIRNFVPGSIVVFEDIRGKPVLLLVETTQPVPYRAQEVALHVSWIAGTDLNQTFPASAVAVLKARASEVAKAVVAAREKEAAIQALAESRRPKAPAPAPLPREQDELDAELRGLARISAKIPADQVRDRFQVLLKAGANVNGKTTGGTSTLEFTAFEGSFEMVQMLVDAGANVDESGALFAAAGRGDLDLCKYLIAHGANPSRVCRNGKTAVQYALRAKKPNPDVVALLREQGATRDSLHVAAEAGDIETIKRLAAEGRDLNAWDQDGMTPLHLAVRGGQVEACRVLLELRADASKEIRKGGAPPLEFALHMKKTEVVPVLLANAPDSALRAALSTAAIAGQTKMVAELLAQMKTPAATLTEREDHTEIADMLLLTKDGEIVGMMEKAGLQLPLWAAARFGRLDRMRELLAAKPNLNARVGGFRRETPLQFAVENGQLEAAKLLIENGADPHVPAKDRSEPTPLHDAAQRGDIAMAKLLLDAKANVNAPDGSGRPPLDYIVRGDNVTMAEVLLKAGADPNIRVEFRDKDGVDAKRPLWRQATNPKMVELLKQSGAKM